MNIKKRESSYKIQESLIEFTSNNNNILSSSVLTHNFEYPNNFVFFHYKDALFSKLLKWDLEKITILLSFFNNNFNNVLFSSELHNEKINDFFQSQFNTFDYKNNKKELINKN